jgi:hypothetical protein
MRHTVDQCLCCRFNKPEAALGAFYVHEWPRAGEDFLYIACLDCFKTYAINSVGVVTTTQGAIFPPGAFNATVRRPLKNGEARH